jgi:cell division septation protein DedD
MGRQAESPTNGPGLSVRQLSLIFAALVALCGMFFALGYILARNQQPANASPTVEKISPPSEVPPEVNPPLESADSPTDSPTSRTKPASPTVIEQDLKGTGGVPTAAQARPAAPAVPAATSPVTAASPRPKAADLPGGMMVQVMASSSKQNARSLVARLKRRGYPAKLITPEEAGENDHVYRVEVGPFTSRKLALRTLRRLSREGFKPFIKKK